MKKYLLRAVGVVLANGAAAWGVTKCFPHPTVVGVVISTLVLMLASGVVVLMYPRPIIHPVSYWNPSHQVPLAILSGIVGAWILFPIVAYGFVWGTVHSLAVLVTESVLLELSTLLLRY